MRKSNVDVVVLGVGTCGEDLSLRLMSEGVSVVGIEANLVGGECPFWACIPTKMMIRAGNAVQEARRVDDLAGHADVSASWAPVAARVRSDATGGWDDSMGTERFAARGGRLIHGRGRLAGPRAVTVGDEEITASMGVVIATGSRPNVPPIPGITDVDYWTTHDVISAEELPESLIIIGGGAVGVELGQLLARFGVGVTIIEGHDRLLAMEEPEASAAIEATFAAEGITVHTGAHVQQIRQVGDRIEASFDNGTASGSKLLVATGRRTELGELGLETIGLDPTARAIPVDENLRTNSEGVWAMGDVTAKAMFTHVALYQSNIVASDILGREHHTARYDALPRVTFTDPEVGAVGLTEAQARAADLDVVTITKNLGAIVRGYIHRTSNGVVKIVIDRGTRIVVGATCVGPAAGEVLGLFSLAVHARLPISELESMIYAFPTFHGGIGEALGAYGRGLGSVFDPDYREFEKLDALRAG